MPTQAVAAGTASAKPATPPGGEPAPLKSERGTVESGENVELAGDLRISGDVRSSSVVSVKGTLRVEGMVEAARLNSGGSMHLLGGIRGRSHAVLTCGESLSGCFFDSVKLEVAHLLRVDREMIGCRALVHGAVDSPEGSIIGGVCHVAGFIYIGSLGSPSASPTFLSVGRCMLLEPLLARVDSALKLVESKQGSDTAELNILNTPGRKLAARDKERKTEITYQSHMLDRFRSKCLVASENLRGRTMAARRIDLRIRQCIHPGVTIEAFGLRMKLREPIEGPVQITRDGRGVLVYRKAGSDSRTPLSRVAEVMAGQNEPIEQL